MSKPTSTSDAPHPLSGKHLIVSGAGIAGLSFIRALNHTWPPSQPRPRITLYDRDPLTLPPSRGNYSLGLRSDSMSGGMQALQRLGLFDPIFSLRVPGSTSGALLRDANWNPILKIKRPAVAPSDLPEPDMRITRKNLREGLLAGIRGYENVELVWEVGCTSAAPTKPDEVGKRRRGMEVLLSTGETRVCDLLIAADGAGSRLRAALRPDDALRFAGATVVGGNATFPPGKTPAKLKEGFGPILGGEGHGLVVFPIEGESFVWFVTRRAKEPRAEMGKGEGMREEEIREEALREGRVFAQPFGELVGNADEGTLKVFDARDKMPVRHGEIEEVPCVFVGDSNHAMSPFAGNGANMALMDGVSLAEALCNSSSIASAVEKFDKECAPRCEKSVKISHFVIFLSHSKGLVFWLAVNFLRIINFFVK